MGIVIYAPALAFNAGNLLLFLILCLRFLNSSEVDYSLVKANQFAFDLDLGPSLYAHHNGYQPKCHVKCTIFDWYPANVLVSTKLLRLGLSSKACLKMEQF